MKQIVRLRFVCLMTIEKNRKQTVKITIISIKSLNFIFSIDFVCSNNWGFALPYLILCLEKNLFYKIHIKTAGLLFVIVYFNFLVTEFKHNLVYRFTNRCC